MFTNKKNNKTKKIFRMQKIQLFNNRLAHFNQFIIIKQNPFYFSEMVQGNQHPKPPIGHSSSTNKTTTESSTKKFDASSSALTQHSNNNTQSNSNFNYFKWEDPVFDETTPKNVTALVGKSAYLSCKVKNLGNKTVSIWIIGIYNTLGVSFRHQKY